MLPPILLLTALVFVIITGLVGLARGFKRFRSSLVVIAGSFVLAFVATLILKPILGDLIGGYLKQLLDANPEIGTMDAIRESMPTAADFLDALPSALIAPFIFSVCYGVILLIAETVRSIVCAIAKRKKSKDNAKEKKTAFNRLRGLAAGMIGGLILAFAFLLPFIGYVGMVSVTVDELNAIAPEIMENILANEETGDMYTNYIEPILNDPYIRFSYKIGGKTVFNAVSVMDIDGTHYPVSKVVSTGISMFGHIMPFVTTEPVNYGDQQIEAVNRLVDDLENDVLFTNICAELISGAATAWEKGESFLGMDAITAEENFKPVLDTVVSTFTTTTNENIVGDLRVVSDIVSTLIRYDAVVLLDQENGDVKAVLSTKGFVSELCLTVQKSERMQPVFFEVAKLGIVLVSDVIGIPSNPDEIYERFLENLASEITAALPEYREQADAAFFEKTLKDTFAQNGIKLSDDAVCTVASLILEKTADAETVDAARVKAFFATELLASVDQSHASYDSLQALCNDISAGKLTSDLATLETIVAQMNEAMPSNPESESHKFEAVVTSAILVMNSLEGEETDLLFAIDSQSVEDVIVELSDTETFTDTVDVLLKGICESEMLAGTGFSAAGIYDELIAGGYNNIANTFETIKHTVKMLESLSASKDSADKADISEELEWLISNMTPASSSVLASQMTPDAVKNYGVSDQSAGPVSDLMTNMFDAMANETGLSEEEYKRESDAINHLFTVSTELSSKDQSESVFGGNIGSAADIADTVLNSKVVSASLVESSYNEDGTLKKDPLAANANLNATDKQDMIDALNDYSTANLPGAEDKEAEKQKISALAAVFNLDIEIAEDGTVTQK